MEKKIFTLLISHPEDAKRFTFGRRAVVEVHDHKVCQIRNDETGEIVFDAGSNYKWACILQAELNAVVVGGAMWLADRPANREVVGV